MAGTGQSTTPSGQFNVVIVPGFKVGKVGRDAVALGTVEIVGNVGIVPLVTGTETVGVDGFRVGKVGREAATLGTVEIKFEIVGSVGSVPVAGFKVGKVGRDAVTLGTVEIVGNVGSVPVVTGFRGVAELRVGKD